MTQANRKPWITQAQADEAEYSTLRSKLNREDSFKTPQERSAAATRFKELRISLMRSYLESRGLA